MEPIAHQGTVTAVQAGKVMVEITKFSACHHCDARHGCGLMDCRNQTVEVAVPDASVYTPGEKVLLTMSPASGMIAVFYAYGLPLLLMLAALIAVSALGGGELLSGISAIIILIPYYFWLFFNSKRHKKRFVFSISKQ